jgi:hypothetical protein
MIQADRVFAARVKAKDGPIGIMMEFFPTAAALKFAGVSEGQKLPPFRFVLTEVLARKLAASMVRQLDGYNPPGPGENLN